MISLKAVKLILKYFDAVDYCVSKRLMRKRPWSEPALTSLLCELLDQDDQADEKLSYSIDQLNADLSQVDGLLDVRFKIETHEYGPDVERWVTQADLGLVLKFDDFLLPRNSWESAWLLQAKRSTPKPRGHQEYTESAEFRSLDKQQQNRMLQLQTLVGADFIRFLLYCPRAEFLSTIVKLKLQHLRNTVLTRNIFDFALGLQLREDLLSSSPTIDAGMFVSEIEHSPHSLGETYASIFDGCAPFSWFIVSQFFDNNFIRSRVSRQHSPPHSDPLRPDLARGIVTGDCDAIKHAISLFGKSESAVPRYLPPHTMYINVSVGNGFTEGSQRIDIER